MTCKSHREPKHKPYGAKRGKYWCQGCDAWMVSPEPNKKAERGKVKVELRKPQRSMK